MSKIAAIRIASLSTGLVLGGFALVAPAFAYTSYPYQSPNPSIVCNRFDPNCLNEEWNYLEGPMSYQPYQQPYQAPTYNNYNYNSSYNYNPTYYAPQPQYNYQPYHYVYTLPSTPYNYYSSPTTYYPYNTSSNYNYSYQYSY